MANVGKIQPRCFWSYVQFPNRALDGQGNPRKAIVFKNPLSFAWEGSVLTQWEGLRVVSALATPDPADTRNVLYLFTHPTIPAYTIKMVWSLWYHGTPPFGSDPWYGSRWDVSAWDGTTELARRSLTNLEPGWVAVSDSPNYQIEWRPGNELVPGTWTRANMRFGGASWADQPEYHPYITRP